MLSFTFYPSSDEAIGTYTVVVTLMDELNLMIKNVYTFTVNIVASPKTGDGTSTNDYILDEQAYLNGVY